MAVSAPFARVLAAGRPQFNARIAEAKRRMPGLGVTKFAAFLAPGVDAVVGAVDAIAPDRTGAVALAAFDIALVLAGQGHVGDSPRAALPNRLWHDVLPRLAPRVAEAPAAVLGALSNAAVQLAALPGVRGGEWIDRMADLAPRAATVPQLLDLGKVLAWRCGAAHFRAGALAAADGLPPALALAAVDATASSAWSEVRAAFDADPWWSPGQAGERSRDVGAFTGFGGSFAQPPQVRVAADGFWVRSGDRYSLLVADAWGAVLLPASAQEFDAGARAVRAGGPALTGTRLTVATRAVDLDLPAEGLQVVANDHTAAVTSPYTHAIRLVALR